MPKYKYTARDAAGKTYRGTMDSEDENSLYQALRADEKYLIESKAVNLSTEGAKLKIPVVADFCRQLGTLLGSGVSLVRALSIMANEDNLKPKIKETYLAILKDVRKGVAFSTALEGRGRAFPPLLINMFKAAEASGSLDQTAKKMAVHYEKEHRLNGKVKSAATYPIILIVLVVVVVLFIVSFIIPQFASLFEGMDLPVATVILLGLSDFVKHHFILLFVMLFLFVFAMRILLKFPKVRWAFDKIKVKIPKLGPLFMTIYTARFARTLSSLYSSGLSIVQALQVGRDTIGNTYISAQFDEAIKKVRRGEPLSESIAAIDGFKSKLSASIAVGEETGNLDEMLDVTAETFDYESEMAIQSMVAILEPALIVVMAGVVGFIMVAIMMPIFGTYEQIENS